MTMHRTQLMSLRICCGAVLLFTVCGRAVAVVQDDGQEARPDPVLPGLRQPGDDDLFELRDESGQIDKDNADALAWYMAGLAAERRGDLQDAAAALRKAAEAAPESAAPLRARAMLLLRMGRIRDGIEDARRAIELDKDDYQTRLQLAILLAGNNALQEAAALTDQALQSSVLSRASREFVVLHQVRARLMLGMGKTSEAADSYEVILQALERPEDFDLQLREHQALLKDRSTGYAATGTVLLEAGRAAAAETAFRALARIEDERPGEHNLLLAQSLYRQDKLDAAEENLNLYFETGRRNQDALVLLQDLLSARSRSDELVPRLKSLAENTTDAAVVRLFLGRVLLDQGDGAAARTVFQQVLDETGEVDAYTGLLRVAIAARDEMELLATLNRAARSRLTLPEIRPLIPGVVLDDQFADRLLTACQDQYDERPNSLHSVVTAFCAAVAAELERTEAEGNLLKATLELNPDRSLHIETLDRYGLNLLLQDKNELSAAAFRQLYAMPGIGPEQRLMALYRLSQAEAFGENYEPALEAIDMADRLAGQPIPLLRYQRGWIQAQAENFDAATEVLESTLEQFPNDAPNVERCRLLLAGISAQQGQWSDAVKWYQAILETPGTDPATARMCRLGLSNAWVQNGDLEQGEQVLLEVYQTDPDDPGVNNDLGYLWADQNKNLEQAEKMIRLAVEAQPDNPAYLDSLGWVLFRLGRNDEALEALIRANQDPEYRDATILEHLGDVYQALDQPDKAQATWKEALEVETGSRRTDDTLVERLRQKLGSAAPPADSAADTEQTPAASEPAESSDDPPPRS